MCCKTKTLDEKRKYIVNLANGKSKLLQTSAKFAINIFIFAVIFSIILMLKHLDSNLCFCCVFLKPLKPFSEHDAKGNGILKVRI